MWICVVRINNVSQLRTLCQQGVPAATTHSHIYGRQQPSITLFFPHSCSQFSRISYKYLSAKKNSRHSAAQVRTRMHVSVDYGAKVGYWNRKWPRASADTQTRTYPLMPQTDRDTRTEIAARVHNRLNLIRVRRTGAHCWPAMPLSAVDCVGSFGQPSGDLAQLALWSMLPRLRSVTHTTCCYYGNWIIQLGYIMSRKKSTTNVWHLSHINYTIYLNRYIIFNNHLNITCHNKYIWIYNN